MGDGRRQTLTVVAFAAAIPLMLIGLVGLNDPYGGANTVGAAMFYGGLLLMIGAAISHITRRGRQRREQLARIEELLDDEGQ